MANVDKEGKAVDEALKNYARALSALVKRETTEEAVKVVQQNLRDVDLAVQQGFMMDGTRNHIKEFAAKVIGEIQALN